MGTDIHVKLLHKTDNGYEEIYLCDKNGKNISYRLNYENRNYDRFNVLCGVRGSGSGLISNRGLFEGTPQEIKDKYEETGYYGATHADWNELVALARTPEAYVVDYWADEDDDDDEDKPLPKMNVLQPWVDSMRVVLDAYGIYYPKPGEVIVDIYFDC